MHNFRGMDSLECDLHSEILLGLASTLAKDTTTTVNEVQRLIRTGPLQSSSQPSTPQPQTTGDAIKGQASEQILAEGGLVTIRHQHALIAQAKFAAESRGQFDGDLIPRLTGYLHSLASYQFSDSCELKGRSPVDILTYNLVTNLLSIASTRPATRQQVLDSIWAYLKKLSLFVIADCAERVCEFVLPSLNGLLAALETSSLEFQPHDFSNLVSYSNAFLCSETAEKIRGAVLFVKQDTNDTYARRILTQYAEGSIILSSNRVVLQVLTVKRNMIGCLINSLRVKKPPTDITENSASISHVEVGSPAFDDIWTTLLSTHVRLDTAGQADLTKIMRIEYIMSLQFFSDMRSFANELLTQGGVSYEFYYSEIMGISLQLASLASVYIHELDDILPTHLSSCLFNEVRTSEFWIHAAALDCSAFLGINFVEASQEMSALLQQFLSTPSPIFDGPDYALIQSCGVERLAQVLVHAQGGEEAAMSAVYALPNTLYSHNTAPGQEDCQALSQAILIQENIIAAISRIACVFKSENITPIVLSMLAQQLRHHSPRLDSVIVSRLTDLALAGSENSFNDVTQILSNIAKLSISPDNKPETKDLCEAANANQLRLARTINTRPEFYSAYLVCLLKLFVEKGVQIQLTVQANKKSQNKINSLSAGLGLLLPVLGTLLSHDDFQPHVRPSKEDIKLFRDVWFHCVLFEFVKDSPWYREWSNSMLLIARKTPAFVSDDLGTNAYLEGDLEYNSVLPRSLLDDQKASMRATLASYLPAQTYEIKSLTSAKVVFLLSVYHVETMRSRQGNCSFVLKYFMNSGVDDTGLAACLEAIADQVINVFIAEAQTKVLSHSLDDGVRQQVRNLVIGCTHRLKKVSALSTKWVQRLIVAFPQLMCDKALLTLVLELGELLWLSCENEMTDEYCPIYTFTSTKVGVTIDLPDSYPYRRDLLSKFVDLTRRWVAAAMATSPQEVDALLQDYLAESEKIHTGVSRVHMGRTLAARSGKDLVKNHNSFDSLANIPGAILDNSSVFFQEFSSRRRYQGEIGGMEFSSASTSVTVSALQSQLPALRKGLQMMLQRVKADQFVSNKDLANALHRAVSALVNLDKIEEDLVKMIAWIPIFHFTPDSLKIGTSVWSWLITEKPSVEKRLMTEIASGWAWTSRHQKGLFSSLLDSEDPFRVRMEYAPSDKKARQRAYKVATYLFAPHVIWIEFLSSRFQATRYGNRDMVDIFTRLLHLTFDHGFKMSTHPLAREGRFQLILLGLRLLQTNRMEAMIEYRIRSALYTAALSWFELPPRWSFGGNRMISKNEVRVMQEFGAALEKDKIYLDMILSSIQFNDAPTEIGSNYKFSQDCNRDAIVRKHTQWRRLLLLLTENELNRLGVWGMPLLHYGSTAPEVNIHERSFSEEGWRNMVRFAWSVSPTLAIQLMSRFKNLVITSELSRLLASDPYAAVHDADAVQILLGDGALHYAPLQLRYLLFWKPVPSITAILYFQPTYHNNPMILQYAMRSLEHSPVEVVFFYVPQIVQALRHDDLGYVEKYIMRAARVSQLFAHQIIWNMNANMYKDNNSEVPDPLKPTLDRIIVNIVHGLSGDAKVFYEREFRFFNQVTSISGTLMPLVKKTKPEKKKKIDEEMAKIVVDVGVYLPSNPDGIIVDIDKRSGRPLQSHAKTPFMATFKVRKTRQASDLEKAIIKRGDGDSGDDEDEPATRSYDVWQSAIFKVGDDCRQDVLAIQLIAVFKNIFTNVGLDLYLFPYRIVATAPGCGVIDVIPNSISRDQLGREKVNNLQDYFVTKYGGIDSIEYQKARNNFIQSVASYSVISYLLQFKDRHNGNIMVDDEGHIIHIDFGFILDISPGGINFESSPFKLTTEMVQIMGTSVEDQGYRWFCELCVKAYLASRPYAEQIIQMVALMLESGLPCFRGETVKRLRSRFQLDRSERSAADFMKEKVDESHLNKRTVLYDSFQKATNGIPH